MPKTQTFLIFHIVCFKIGCMKSLKADFLALKWITKKKRYFFAFCWTWFMTYSRKDFKPCKNGKEEWNYVRINPKRESNPGNEMANIRVGSTQTPHVLVLALSNQTLTFTCEQSKLLGVLDTK